MSNSKSGPYEDDQHKVPSPSSHDFPGNRVLYFLLGSILLIYLSGSTRQQGTGKGRCSYRWMLTCIPRQASFLKVCLRSRNHLFIFGGLNLGLQQYLGFFLRIVLTHSSPLELLYP